MATGKNRKVHMNIVPGSDTGFTAGPLHLEAVVDGCAG